MARQHIACPDAAYLCGLTLTGCQKQTSRHGYFQSINLIWCLFMRLISGATANQSARKVRLSSVERLYYFRNFCALPRSKGERYSFWHFRAFWAWPSTLFRFIVVLLKMGLVISCYMKCITHFGITIPILRSAKQAIMPASMMSQKSLHVSPFYNMDGEYRLGLKLKDRTLRLLVRYSHEMKTRLTATLDGTFHPFSSGRLLSFLCRYLHLPMRVWTAIHVEAVKLFLKRCRFHRRPEPETTPVTIAQPRLTRQKG